MIFMCHSSRSTDAGSCEMTRPLFFPSLLFLLLEKGCIRNGNYEEALDLEASVSKFSKMHVELPVTQALEAEVRKTMQSMLSQLLQKLRSNIQLPECLRIVAHLRRIGAFTESELRFQRIYAKVNSLTSIETELPYSYYNLPYCHPQGGIKRSAENLGELLMGDQIDNSPYRFHVNVNESLYLCTTNALNEHEVKLLKQRTHDLYQVNMILDNLRAMLKLNMYDKVEFVSCPLELDKSQTIREQEKISFTYEVVFVKSDIRWPSRWDAYLKNNIYEVVLGVRACRGRPDASCAPRWGQPHAEGHAGSERLGKIEVEGEKLKESQFINKSLSTLGDKMDTKGIETVRRDNCLLVKNLGLTKTGSDYNVKSAHVELAEKMRKFTNLKYSRVEIDEVRFE
ncbi:hypothetical protein ZIOFF_062716 [Zingiber officinale]|uniref:Conserved oligomeric Golgi complex subunit 8 n=1 Tax=Zingiber officinale TaxID=94328 RepID=A0A8J5FA22_ZINOF|nr:hypothetical protein ZIOFF_062716 [Zingiber officinale]